MDGTVDSTTTKQTFVGCIDDSINLERCDAVLNMADGVVELLRGVWSVL